MAKSARVSRASGAASARRAQELFTPTERRLLGESDAGRLAQAAPEDVKATLVRTREARDKWRALAGRQNRDAKRSPRAVAEANTRSHAKAEQFAQAVQRLETHLAKSGGPAAAAVRKASGKTPKKLRVAANRKARAGLRAEMRGKTVAAGAAAKPVASAVLKTAAKPVVVAAKPAEVSAPKPAAPSVKVAAKTKSRKAKRPLVAAGPQAVRFDAGKQRSLRAAAKNSRLVAGGLATRRTSHVIATGKRSQARRDKRR